MKKAGSGLGPRQPATMLRRQSPYQRRAALSTENLRLCAIADCIEPRSGRNGFCTEHDRQFYRESYRSRVARYRTWFDAKREAVIRALLAASTPTERVAIEKGRREGRRLRAELEAMS